jgi:26S proteasome regulatory subunit N13
MNTILAKFVLKLTLADLIHFCWRPRSVPLDQPELDLIIPPQDAHFDRYLYTPDPPESEWRAPTNGRIAVLKFSSSSQRHCFWLQSKSQSSRNDPSWWSARDKELIVIVDQLLAGEEVDVQQSLANIPDNNDDDGGDTAMEDADAPSNPGPRRSSTGGAGGDATGGDFREEGEEAREGGADGGRA